MDRTNTGDNYCGKSYLTQITEEYIAVEEIRANMMSACSQITGCAKPCETRKSESSMADLSRISASKAKGILCLAVLFQLVKKASGSLSTQMWNEILDAICASTYVPEAIKADGPKHNMSLNLSALVGYVTRNDKIIRKKIVDDEYGKEVCRTVRGYCHDVVSTLCKAGKMDRLSAEIWNYQCNHTDKTYCNGDLYSNINDYSRDNTVSNVCNDDSDYYHFLLIAIPIILTIFTIILMSIKLLQSTTRTCDSEYDDGVPLVRTESNSC